MHPYDPVPGDGQKTVRILIAQIILGHQGNPAQIIKSLYRIRTNARAPEQRTVIRRLRRTGYGLLQEGELQAAQLLSVHGFCRFIPVHHSFFSYDAVCFNPHLRYKVQGARSKVIFFYRAPWTVDLIPFCFANPTNQTNRTNTTRILQLPDIDHFA